MEIRKHSAFSQFLHNVRAVILATLMLGGAPSGYALVGVSAPALTNSTYTVTLTGTCGGILCYVEERIGTTGSWTSFSAITTTVSGKPVGSYFYRSVEFFFNGFSSSTNWSSPVQVTVISGQVPVQDTVAVQMSYGYQARRGDINGDGLPDLYVARTSGGMANNGVIEKVILQQAAGGTFTTVVPSTVQISTASAWPAVAPNVRLRDFNLDGFVDVELSGLAGIVTGALDQIVLSSGQLLVSAPLGTVPVTARFKKIVTEIDRWMRNPNYYVQNAPLVTAISVVVVYQCFFSLPNGDFYGNFYACFFTAVPVQITYRDYSAFDPDAMHLRNAFQVINGILSTVLVPGDAPAREIDAAWRGGFGFPILRDILRIGCAVGSVFQYDPDNPIQCANTDIFGTVILATASDERDKAGPPERRVRLLTIAEKAIAVSEGISIYDIAQVRIFEGPPFARSTTTPTMFNGDIYTGSATDGVPFLNEYAIPPIPWMSVIVHELVHVYQFRKENCGSMCMQRKSIESRGGNPNAPPNYTYMPPVPGREWHGYNIEQQAEMVSDRFLLHIHQRVSSQFGNQNVTLSDLAGVPGIPHA